LLAGTLAAVQAATVSGFVREAANGEPLSYVSVYLKDRSAGTATDKTGYYVLSGLPAGEQTVVFSLVGYKELERVVALKPERPTRLDARLSVEAIPMKGVTASAERQRFRREVDIGVKRLDIRDLKIVPGFIEQDLFRSLQMLPGVMCLSDFASALYVRGGSPDQNLVLLDGVPVYNPYHLGGLFSTFSMDALAGAELKAGAFPAEYGNAVSSVLDVEMKQGNSEQYAGRWDVGLLTSKLTFEGPLPRGSFLVSGRRTYIDGVTWVLDKVINDSLNNVYLPYYFYDLAAKAGFDLSERDRVTLSGYSGDDIIYINDSTTKLDFRWGNYTLALKERHMFSPRLLLSSLLAHGRNRVGMSVEDRYFGDTSRANLRMTIYDYGLKEDLTWFADSGHTLKTGIEAKYLNIANYLKVDTVQLWNMGSRAGYVAAHVGDKWQPNEKWVVNPGVRAEYFTGGSYLRVSPRLSAKYFLHKDLALTAGLGRYYQYLSIPFPRDEFTAKLPATFFQQWIPADTQYAPVWADHVLAGAEKWFASDVQFTAEAYYKNMGNLLETRSDLPGLFGDEENDSVRFSTGTGWASGLELLLRRKGSWFGYGLSVTRRTFDSTSFFPVFDARHNFNVAWSVPLGRRWTMNLQWLLRTGFPYTGPVGMYQFVEPDPENPYQPEYPWNVLYGRRGNYRLPPYHRLDIGFDKAFSMFRMECAFYIQVINVYFARNVMWYDYHPDENGRLVREPFYILPVAVPSLGLRGSF
jgi:hypothetical protein